MKNIIPDVITSEYIRESWSKMSEPMQEMITLLLDKIKYHQDQLETFNAIDNRASFRNYLTGINIILKDKYGTYQFNPILFDLNFNMRGPIAQMVSGQLKEKVRKQAVTQSATSDVDEGDEPWEEIQPINIQDEVREKVENVLDQNPQFKVTPQEKNKIVEIMLSQPDGVITMNRILKVFKQLRQKQNRSTLRKKIGFGGNKTRRIRKKNLRKKKTRKLQDIKTRKMIYNTLKKNYMNYNEKIWSKILTEKKWEDYFDKNWLDQNKKRDHGGYITKSQLKQLIGNNSTLPKELPTIKIKKNVTTINIPTCAYNSKNYQKEYINTLRNFLIQFNNEILELDLSENGGGKTEVIASGLLPLFLLQPNKNLTYIVDSKEYRKTGLKISNNEISKLPVKVSKTKQMSVVPKKIVVIMGEQTASAAEQIILALKVMDEITLVEYAGNPTAGFTTWIEYIDLPNGGGLEYPVGTMTTFSGIKSRSDGKIYPEDLN